MRHSVFVDACRHNRSIQVNLADLPGLLTTVSPLRAYQLVSFLAGRRMVAGRIAAPGVHIKEFFDIANIRSRLERIDVDPVTKQAYLTTLLNIKTISDLLTPHPEMEEEDGRPQLERLFQAHQRRKQQLELEFPVLATLSRSTDWKFQ